MGNIFGQKKLTEKSFLLFCCKLKFCSLQGRVRNTVCCGRGVIDKRSTICCGSRAYRGSPSTTRCCGVRSYYTRSQKCCPGSRPISLSQRCPGTTAPAPRTICGSANENGQAVLQCPAGLTVQRILFASFGRPTGNGAGDCEMFQNCKVFCENV